MNESEVLSLFEKTQALLKGHFLLSSGLHSPQYMQCARLLAHPDLAERLGRALAQRCGAKPDLVVSPAMGGLIIGQEVARALGVRHYFTERENGVMTLRRGFSIEPGESILVVEDVLTTGKSSQEVIDVLRALGGEPAAVAAIVDRSSGRTRLPVPKASLVQLTIPSFAVHECPECRAGIAVVKPGSRTPSK